MSKQSPRSLFFGWSFPKGICFSPVLARLRRPLQSLLLLVAAIVILGAGDPAQRHFDRLGHQLMCTCSCSQILVECNHVGCPVSPVMIAELRARLAAGDPDAVIFRWFAAKYGGIALAAPIRGGFDNVAWIAPIALFLLGTLGTAFVVWLWRRRTATLLPAVVPVAPADTALRDRIRRETEYR
jgi:cytochrome c-type biogenesis protein CcmH/NrfF